MKKLGNWIIVLKLVEEGETFDRMSTTIHPRYDLEENSKINFWEDLNAVIQGIPLGELDLPR